MKRIYFVYFRLPIAFFFDTAKALIQFLLQTSICEEQNIVKSMPKLNDFHISCRVLLYFYINIYDFLLSLPFQKLGQDHWLYIWKSSKVNAKIMNMTKHKQRLF